MQKIVMDYGAVDAARKKLQESISGINNMKNSFYSALATTKNYWDGEVDSATFQGAARAKVDSQIDTIVALYQAVDKAIEEQITKFAAVDPGI